MIVFHWAAKHKNKRITKLFNLTLKSNTDICINFICNAPLFLFNGAVGLFSAVNNVTDPHLCAERPPANDSCLSWCRLHVGSSEGRSGCCQDRPSPCGRGWQLCTAHCLFPAPVTWSMTSMVLQLDASAALMCVSYLAAGRGSRHALTHRRSQDGSTEGCRAGRGSAPLLTWIPANWGNRRAGRQPRAKTALGWRPAPTPSPTRLESSSTVR